VVNKKFINPWEGVKVDSIEMVSSIVSQNDACWKIVNIIFLIDPLTLKFGPHVINIEKILCQKFNDKKIYFQSLGRC